MTDVTAQRTLVKSPPELWSELSEVESLARHLGELGEIRITKVEPETTVAWEGEQISGTVELEQSGWGTKVTLCATVPESDRPADEPVPSAAEPVAEAEAAEPTAPAGPTAPAEPTAAETVETEAEPVVERPGFWARIFGRRRSRPEVPARPETVDAVPNEPEPVELEPTEPEPVEPEPVEPEPVEPEPVEPAPVEPQSSELEAEAAETESSVAPALDAERVQAVFDGTLDSLGQAHHRPFSRS